VSPLHADRLARFQRAGVYFVTSAAQSGGRPTEAVVEAALRGGVRLVQLREKEMPLHALLALARRLRNATRRAGALLIINDRVDLALAVEADGVHLGQDDFPIADARRVAPDLLIGTSTHDEAEVRRADEEGASYLNIGPVYPTRTKAWSDAFLGVESVARLGALARIPFSVMGGIERKRLPELVAAGARTVAVVSAIAAAPDPAVAARDLLEDLRRLTAG
jgi:thiamine-phosphate pyrophosphorylase